MDITHGGTWSEGTLEVSILSHDSMVIVSIPRYRTCIMASAGPTHCAGFGPQTRAGIQDIEIGVGRA